MMKRTSLVERFAAHVLLDIVSDGLIILNDELVIEWSNNIMSDMLETSLNDIEGESIWHFINQKKQFDELLTTSKQGIPSSNEILWVVDSKEPLITNTTSIYIASESGSQSGYILVVKESVSEKLEILPEESLTLYKKWVASLKTNIETLRISERKYRALYENLSDGVFIADTKGIITMCSDRGARLFGYEPKELLGTHFQTLLHPKDKERVLYIFAESIASHRTIPRGMEVLGIRKDGSSFPFHITNTLLFDNGKPSGFQSLIRDITEIKKVQEALKQSEERYRDLFNNTPIIIWEEDFTEVGKWLDNLRANGVTDLKKYLQNNPDAIPYAISLIKGVDVNQLGVKIFEADSKESLLSNLTQIIPEASYDNFSEELLAIWNGYPDRIEFESSGITKKGTPFDTFVIWKVPTREQQFDLSSVIVTVEDISERKRIENELRESERRLELALKGAKLGSWDLNYQTGIETHDERWAEILGYDVDELEQKQSTWENLIHPDEKQCVVERWNAHVRGKIPFYQAEYRMRTKSGDWKWILDWGGVVEWDDEGKPARASGIHRDVTQEHLALDALRESEERHRMVVQSMNDLIFVFDKNDMYNQYYVSDEKLLYVPPELFIGKHISEVLPPHIAELFHKQFNTVRSTKKPQICDYSLTIKGKEFWFSASLNLHEDGESIVTVIRDITQRKITEQALRESEDRYRVLVESSPYGIVVHSAGKLLFANPAALRITGLKSIKDFDDKSVLDIVHPDYIDAVKKRVQLIYEGKIQVEPVEEKWLKPDGSIVDVEVSASSINFAGKPASQVMFNDIATRKKAEDELEIVVNQLKQLEAIITKSPAMAFLWRIDKDWPVDYVSDNVSQLGYEAEDFISGKVSWPAITNPDDVPQLEEEVVRYLKEGIREWSQEYRIITKSGEVRWFADRSLVLRNSEGIATHIQGIVLDITSQKTAEKALKTERDRAMLYLDLMGHDIRNNLQAIIAGVDIIERSNQSIEFNEILFNIRKAAEKCGKIITKVKRTERLTEIPLILTNYIMVVNQIAAEFRDTRILNIIEDYSLDKAPINADEFLYDLIRILLENTIAHNPYEKKTTWINMKVQENGFLLSIADNGSGISNSTKDLLFDMERRFGGVGLHQARQIVEKYGGWIEVHDRILGNHEKGAEFRVWIPRATEVTS